MAPGSPKPVEDLEDVGPGDMANYGLALDGDQQAEFEIEEEQVRTIWPHYGPADFCIGDTRHQVAIPSQWFLNRPC